MEHFGVRPHGNFEKGTSVLFVEANIEELNRRHGIPHEEIRAILARSKEKLLRHRQQRQYPFRDEKIICAWNGMMVSAFARAGRILGNKTYLEAAVKAVDFTLKNLIFPDGRLRRSYRTRPSDVPGFLEDYAFFTSGLIDLYQSTFDQKYLDQAKRLASLTVRLFWSDAFGTFNTVEERADGLIVNPRDAVDQSIPSGGSVTARNLFLLQAVLEGVDTGGIIERFLGTHSDQAIRNPWGYATLLSVADSYMQGPTEVVLVGKGLPGAVELAGPVWRSPIPDTVLYTLPPNWTGEEGPEVFRGKQVVDGQPTAYLCQNFHCTPPITDPHRLEKAFREGL